jgi:hypothetical protein
MTFDLPHRLVGAGAKSTPRRPDGQQHPVTIIGDQDLGPDAVRPPSRPDCGRSVKKLGSRRR